jgi:hypothetical protein
VTITKIAISVVTVCIPASILHVYYRPCLTRLIH